MLGLVFTIWIGSLQFWLAHPEGPREDLQVKDFSQAGYLEMKAEMKADRDSLGKVFLGLPDSSQAAYLETTRLHLRSQLENELIPCWYGTEWDFNGITQTPGKGLIACGYFVSTLLRDLGYSLERYRLAQQAALHIVHSLSPAEHRWDWSGISTAELSRRVQEMPQGFYVVGLDNHVGFLFHEEDGTVWFIHSSYMDPVAVVRELATRSEPLAASNRYVLGYLESDWLIRKWLLHEKIETVKG